MLTKTQLSVLLSALFALPAHTQVKTQHQPESVTPTTLRPLTKEEYEKLSAKLPCPKDSEAEKIQKINEIADDEISRLLTRAVVFLDAVDSSLSANKMLSLNTPEFQEGYRYDQNHPDPIGSFFRPLYLHNYPSHMMGTGSTMLLTASLAGRYSGNYLKQHKRMNNLGARVYSCGLFLTISGFSSWGIAHLEEGETKSDIDKAVLSHRVKEMAFREHLKIYEELLNLSGKDKRRLRDALDHEIEQMSRTQLGVKGLDASLIRDIDVLDTIDRERIGNPYMVASLKKIASLYDNVEETDTPTKITRALIESKLQTLRYLIESMEKNQKRYLHLLDADMKRAQAQILNVARSKMLEVEDVLEATAPMEAKE